MLVFFFFNFICYLNLFILKRWSQETTTVLVLFLLLRFRWLKHHFYRCVKDCFHILKTKDPTFSLSDKTKPKQKDVWDMIYVCSLPAASLNYIQCRLEILSVFLVPLPADKQRKIKSSLTKIYQFWIVELSTWFVVIGTAPGWSMKNCLSSRRSANSNIWTIIISFLLSRKSFRQEQSRYRVLFQQGL